MKTRIYEKCVKCGINIDDGATMVTSLEHKTTCHMHQNCPESKNCDYLCAWTKPYGFVPEAGCPIHDSIKSVGKELFKMVYNWGKVGVVTDHKCFAFKSTMQEIIQQAIAEERERMSKLSRYELGGYPEEGYSMEESQNGEYVKFADLLS